MKTFYVPQITAVVAVLFLFSFTYHCMPTHTKSEVEIDIANTFQLAKSNNPLQLEKLFDKYYQLELSDSLYCKYFKATEKIYTNEKMFEYDETYEDIMIVYENLDCHCK